MQPVNAEQTKELEHAYKKGLTQTAGAANKLKIQELAERFGILKDL